MKPLRLSLLVALVLLQFVFSLGVWSSALARDVPPLTGRVNDTARILSPETIRLLNLSLQTLEANDSTQIVVLTIPSLEGEGLEGFAVRVFEQWKIGQKGVDNGALLLIAVKDRKVRIEVGYGLEGRLTDLVAGRIIGERIVPAFKQGSFDQGVTDGVAAMITSVKGEYSGARKLTVEAVLSDILVYLALLISGLLLLGCYGRHRLLVIGLGGVFASLLAAVAFGHLFSWYIMVLFIPLGMIGAFVSIKFVKWFDSIRWSELSDSNSDDRIGSDSDGGGCGWGRSGGFSGGSDFSGGDGSSGGGGASGGW